MLDDLLDSFTSVYKKEIFLHKRIDVNDIRVMYYDGWNELYIFDKNDIPDAMRRINHLDLKSVEKTRFQSRVLRFKSWSVESIVYPYVTNKTLEEMDGEEITALKRKNTFLIFKDTIHNTKFMTLLEYIDSRFYINMYCNKTIIDRVLRLKRERYYYMLLELLCIQKKENMYDRFLENLNCLGEPVTSTNTFLETGTNLFKNDMTLYDYQKKEVGFMRNIESMVDNNTNIINLQYAPEMLVCDDRLIIYDQTIMLPLTIPKLEKNIRFYGGNLTSVMGLGKTIVALSHIFSDFSDRDLYDRFVSFEYSCNYMYKRGGKKGTFCHKPVRERSLYCKTHHMSLFLERRKTTLVHLEELNINDFVACVDEPTGTGFAKRNLLKSNGTLVVCPSHLCDQWIKEYYNKFTVEKRVLLIVTKDQFNNLTLGDLIFADLVVVSYNILVNQFYRNILALPGTRFIASDFNFSSQSEHIKLLYDKQHIRFDNIYWKRVMLDEVHEIQNMPKSQILRSILKSINSKYKWNISGTPFANGVSSFLNLMSYITDFDHKRELDWNTLHSENIITSEINLIDDLIGKTRHLFIKNTKLSVENEYTGNVIKESRMILDFTNEERSIYDSYKKGNDDSKSHVNFLIKLCCHCELNEDTRNLIQKCKTFGEIQKVLLDFNGSKIEKLNTQINLLQNSINSAEEDLKNALRNNDTEEELYIKALLATHRKNLTLKSKEYDSIKRIHDYLRTAINNLREKDSCPICLDDITQISITKCGHKFCWECLEETYKVQKTNFKCPTCNQYINSNEIYVLDERISTSGIENTNVLDVNAIVNSVKSTKIGNIIHFISNYKSNEKTILFSQWDEMLHKVGNQLTQYGIGVVYCNGSVFQKHKMIQQFCNDPEIAVILLSSKHAASGINLTVANNIIMLEPVYGSIEYRKDIESQAIGRADRIGQRKSINVYRFIIGNTIEEDISNGNTYVTSSIL